MSKQNKEESQGMSEKGKIPKGFYLKARVIQESDIAHKPPHYREIWDWLLMTANHQNRKVHGKVIRRGQLHCTIEDIREGLHWRVGYRKERYSQDDCENAIRWFKAVGMITTARTTRGAIVTTCNYGYYQNPKNYSVTRSVTKNQSVTESGAAACGNGSGNGTETGNGNGTQKPHNSLQEKKLPEQERPTVTEQKSPTVTEAATEHVRNDKQEGFKELKKSTKENTPSVSEANRLNEFFKNEGLLKTEKEKYSAVFDHWNSKQIITHRKLTDKIKRKVKSALKDYTEEEIQGTIDNYAIVISGAGTKYYWPENQRWTFIEFLQRGLDRFLPSADPLKSFLKSGTSQTVQTLICKSEKCGRSFDDNPEKECSFCGAKWRP